MRAHLKDLLDAAEKGRVATVRLDSATIAVVDVERLRHFLASIVPSHAQVVPEAGGWSVAPSARRSRADRNASRHLRTRSYRQQDSAHPRLASGGP
jgi:hypothetical protein